MTDSIGDNGTMDHLIAATLAVFAGSIVEGVLGFGCSLVWMSFFPLFTTVPDAVGVLQPMHIALNVILLASIWRQCTPNELKPLLTTVPFGIVFGLWIVTSWSSNAIDCVLGIFLIVYTFIKKKNDGNHDKDDDKDHDDNHDDEHVIYNAENNANANANNANTNANTNTNTNSTSTAKMRKNNIKRKTSDLELKPIEEVQFDFGEEKKDDNSNSNNNNSNTNNTNTKSSSSSPTPTTVVEELEMPHPTLEMSPLTHRRHPHSIEAGGGGCKDAGESTSTLYTPNLHNLYNTTYNNNNNSNNNSNSNQQQHQHLLNTTPLTKPAATNTNTNTNNTNSSSRNNHHHKNNTKMMMNMNHNHNRMLLRNPTAICAGLVGGALMGAFGTGGPAFLIYAKEAGWQTRSPKLFRANLQLLFFAINFVVCVSQVAEGIITWNRCKASGCLLPALVAGGYVGGILATKVPREKFELLVVNGLRIMGLMFLIEAAT